MEPTIPLSLALYDFVPNIIFLAGAMRMRLRHPSRLFLLGIVLTFINGLTKAVWKTIIAVGGPDINWLSQIFVVFLSLGFLCMFLAVLRDALRKRSQHPAAFAPAMALWKIPFMVLAVISAVGLYILWIRQSLRERKWLPAAAFLLALIAILAMSGLSSTTFDLNRHWTAQTVNTVGQICFAVGAYRLTARSAAQQ